MAFTEFYVRTDGNNDFGGSSDSATAKDSSADATASHSSGGLHTILDNVGGSFSNTAVDDFIAWDVGGTKELGIVTVKTDSSNITVQSLSGTVAFTNLANVAINIGGSWATIQYAADTVNHSATVSDDWRNAAADPVRVNVKHTADYDETVDFDTQTGLPTDYILFQGYTIAVGDGDRPKWTNTTDSTGTFKMTGDRFYHIKDFDLDMTAATPFPTLYNNNTQSNVYENLDVTGDYTAGIIFAPKWSTFRNCSIHIRATKSGPNISASPGSGCFYTGCEFYGGNDATSGNCAAAAGSCFDYCVFRNSVAGPGCHVGAGSLNVSFNGCVFYNNAGDGLNLLSNATVNNTIFTENGAYGIDANSVAAFGGRNAFFNNTTAATNGNYIAMGDGDVTITGDPFTDAASQDFSLDNTANQGAALRQAGFPGTFLDGKSEGFIDIGAVIHEDPAGGGGGTPVHFIGA